MFPEVQIVITFAKKVDSLSVPPLERSVIDFSCNGKKL
jgi:hypothetical protein